MKELLLGKITNAELADWFGVSTGSFATKKKEKLEELKYYANFYEDRGKIVITEIFNPVYSKQLGKNYQKIKEKVNEVWSPDGLDTCSRVGEEIYEILSEEDSSFDLKNTTVVNYTRQGRNELYGKPFIGGGKIGECIYVWCKRDPESGKYSLFNEQEDEIKKRLQQKYFGDTTEKQILVKGMVDSGEITHEEAWDVLEELTNMKTGGFMGFLQELQAEVGCQVVRGTLVKRNLLQSAWQEES